MEQLDKENIRDILALTPMQEGMLYYYLENPGSPYYFEQLSLELEGEICHQLFERAWDFVVDANEMLRTVFRWEKMEHPLQIILDHYKIKPNYYDFSRETSSEKKKQVQEIKDNDRRKPFDLRQVPFRLILCKMRAGKYEMIISNYHILYDGWSNGIILKEFLEAYKALSGNVKEPAGLFRGVSKTRFKEFVKWMQNQDKNEQKKYWNKYLQRFDSWTELSIKRKKTFGITTPGDFQIRFDKTEKDKLEDFVKGEKITLASVFYSACGLLLQRYNNCEDVVFGTTVAGRSVNLPGIKNMVGLLINTIPLRVQSFLREKNRDFLHRIHINLQSRESYEQTPLVQIKETIKTNNTRALFDTVVVVENYPLDRQLMSMSNPFFVKSYSMVESTHYDLTIVIKVFSGIEFIFLYHKEYFNHDDIVRLANHFKGIIEQMVQNPEKEVTTVQIISGKEKEQLLNEFNRTCTDFPNYKTITWLLEEQVEQIPGHTALLGSKLQITNYKKSSALRAGVNACGEMYLTYRELNRKSNQTAHWLKEKGVSADTIVGIMVERSMEMILGILAILKAGGAYLPIDPDYPEEWINYMLSDSGAKMLVTTPGLSEKFKKLLIVNCQLSIINCQWEITCFAPGHSPLEPSPSTCQVSPTNLAYIIYTSGSTGRPKGVMVEQSPVINLLWAMQRRYPLKDKDTYLLKTSYLFDVSVTELFGWFFQGGRLAVLEPGGEKDPGMIADAVERWGVTHINFVPSMFNLFVGILNYRDIRKLSGLKYIFLAGEALLPKIVNSFRHLHTGIVLENIYGPTEAAVYASWYSLSDWNGRDSIPIGKPLPNVELYILDMWGNLQPIAVPGELCISGAGLARGYLNRPELTGEKFCLRRSGGSFRENRPLDPRKSFLLEGTRGLAPLPDRKTPGEKDYMQSCNHAIMQPCSQASMPSPQSPSYHTGDLARWQLDGNIEFLGRMDFQVKVRGFRIELGEIQNRLLSHRGVKEVVVTAGPDKTGQNVICAYIVPASKNSVDISQLKNYLQQKLPAYMVPSHFVMLEKIPLTLTGKIDRNSLPEPGIASTKKYIAPRDDIEKVLAGIWSRLLGIDREKIGIDDDFFEIGGHSLKSTALVSLVHKQFNVIVPLSQLFKTSHIRGLAAYIKDAARDKFSSIEPVEKKEYYMVSSAQKRMYVLQQMDPQGIAYNIPSLWKLGRHIHRDRFEDTFLKLIRRHESLRTSFHLKANNPVQTVEEQVDFGIEYFELDGDSAVEPQGESERSAIQKIIRNFVRRFQLSQAPLLRAGLIKSPVNDYIMLIDIHHIISDAISLNVLIKEFNALNKREYLPIPRVQYKDYTQWHYREKQKKSRQVQEKYWLKQFEGDIPVLNMPTDYPRPPVQQFEGNIIFFCIDQDLTVEIRSFVKKTGITIYMLLLAVFYIVLSKYTRQEDIIIGSPVTGRRHPDLQDTSGMFVNMLPIRNRPGKNKTFKEFLWEIKENVLDAIENQDYQFEELVEQLGIERVPGRNPLFDVVFEFQNKDSGFFDDTFAELCSDLNENWISRFDLVMGGKEVDETIRMHLYYLTVLYKKASAEKIMNRFLEILAQVIVDSSAKLKDIRISSDLLVVKSVVFEENQMEDFEF